MHGRLREFLPVVIVLDEKLEVAIHQTKMRETSEVERNEPFVREQVVDERKNIEGEIHTQLPGIFKGHRLLISEHIVAHGKARHIRAVKRLHQVFVRSDLGSELALVLSQDCVRDKRVMQRDEIATWTIKRIGESSGLSGNRPTR